MPNASRHRTPRRPTWPPKPATQPTEEPVLDPVLIIVIVVVLAVLLGAGFVLAGRRPRPGAPPTTRPPAQPASSGVVEAPPASLRVRLARTRHAVGDRVASLLGRGRFDEEFWTELEETLLAADVGVAATASVVAGVRDRNVVDGDHARAALEDRLLELFANRDRALTLEGTPAVILVVGVNGTGKTTSIAKLAGRLQSTGSSVLLGAADTFRAAADEQLRTWAGRVGVEIVGGQPGADPASVAFDAYQAAKARGSRVVIIDTAGRLQTKANLMDELSKVARVLRREAGAIDEVLLVLDGTTGQNAIAQAKSFTEAVGVTGIVITKLDGTAKGGIAVAIEQEFGIPVKFIGVGEGVGDLVPFEPVAFVDALLGA